MKTITFETIGYAWTDDDYRVIKVESITLNGRTLRYTKGGSIFRTERGLYLRYVQGDEYDKTNYTVFLGQLPGGTKYEIDKWGINPITVDYRAECMYAEAYGTTPGLPNFEPIDMGDKFIAAFGANKELRPKRVRRVSKLRRRRRR